MSTENGTPTSTLIDFARHAPPLPKASRRSDDDAAARLRANAALRRPQSRTGFTAQPKRRLHADDPLPLGDFLRQLQREKRRAERSQAPLSLVLYQIDDDNVQDPRHADRLLDLLQGAKRETDILGHVGDDTLAVLCPDTDERGTRGFVQKIEALAGGMPFATMAATYPDDLFATLASGSRAHQVLRPFLESDWTHHGHGGYPLKRALDIVGALTALLMFAPLMLLVGAAIALTSRGPVIFRQTRLGRGGVPFTFYKFRSMVIDGDDGIHREFVARLIKGDTPQHDGNDAPYKLGSDPRVTRLGRLIRRTSIDELPQFFNVLKGDMSLVGPRPPIPYEAANYEAWHLRRILSMKPGITGVWQVEGRSKVTFNDMVRMDLRYIRHCTLGLDLKILLKTVIVVLRCDGAT